MRKRVIDLKDFLRDDLFIYWRLSPCEELDRFWEEFLQENEDLREQFNEAIVEFDNLRTADNWFPQEAIEVEEVLNRRIRITIRKKNTLRTLYASLSAAIFILGIITLFFLNNNKRNSEKDVTSISIGNVVKNSKIQLVTGSDILDINDNSTLDLSERENSALIQDSLSHKEVILDKNQTNKLIVPFGKRSSLVLADGSRIDLNSGTEMEFPTIFSPHSREITVEGEIFINVVKQGSIPFIIHTPNSQITVYGTSFNVSAYADENKESVVLVTGSVEIKSGNNSMLLNPDEMAVIEDGIIHREQVDVTEYISWTNGYLRLNKTPLNEVLTKIGRYYNVEFQFQSDLGLHEKTCSGKLYLSNNMEDVLNAFSKMTSFIYEKNNDNIYIVK